MALYIISQISACASMMLGRGGGEGRCLGFRHLELTGKEAKMSLEALGYGRMQTTSSLYSDATAGPGIKHLSRQGD